MAPDGSEWLAALPAPEEASSGAGWPLIDGWARATLSATGRAQLGVTAGGHQAGHQAPLAAGMPHRQTLLISPEAHVLKRPHEDPESGTPAFKRVPVLVRGGLRG